MTEGTGYLEGSFLLWWYFRVRFPKCYMLEWLCGSYQKLLIVVFLGANEWKFIFNTVSVGFYTRWISIYHSYALLTYPRKEASFDHFHVPWWALATGVGCWYQEAPFWSHSWLYLAIHHPCNVRKYLHLPWLFRRIYSSVHWQAWELAGYNG